MNRQPPPDDPIRLQAVYESGGVPLTGEDPAAWLFRAGRVIARDAALVDELCWRLVGAGIPLWRTTVHVATLHPQILGFGCRWWRDRRVTEEFIIAVGTEQTAEFLESPVRRVVLEGERERFRLLAGEGMEFALLGRLRAAGGTDYLALPLFQFNGRHPVVTWCTDAPGGFTPADIARLEALTPSLGLVLEARAMRKVAANLMETYLGRLAGPRILAGDIRQGRGQRLRAVIMASDLRDFTGLSDRLPGEEVIELLDAYFEIVAGRVRTHGGEVLKFIGDGVLAIFPVEGDHEPRAASAALDAASESLLGLEGLNHPPTGSMRALRAGVGLHVGDIIYGNVGASDRLDFTAIGPAVNLAFRLEGLTKTLGRPLLASADFARLLPERLMSLSHRPVRGFLAPQEVFAPR